jgi:hypothetical protein
MPKNAHTPKFGTYLHQRHKGNTKEEKAEKKPAEKKPAAGGGENSREQKK